jgi:hypothetical protein
MSMTRVLFGLATLPLLAGVALAAPNQLTDRQMDKISAGSDFFEHDASNGAVVVVAVHERAPFTFQATDTSTAHPESITVCINQGPTCGTTAGTGNNNIGGTINPGVTGPTPTGASPYYLLINNYALSVGAAFR